MLINSFFKPNIFDSCLFLLQSYLMQEDTGYGLLKGKQEFSFHHERKNGYGTIRTRRHRSAHSSSSD
ncbi:hypothetical protein E4V51_10630 [Paenibacillus sp. 28ISP30-2]|nr:hypothetical protein [Paenibacillus sp. 28ISP30-2]